MNYTIEKIVLDTGGVRKLLQSNETMKALIDNSGVIGEMETNFVGFDRCHVIVKDENNAYRENDP